MKKSALLRHSSFAIQNFLMDLFDFFRYVLGTVATVYAIVVVVQSAMGWYVWLHQPERHMSLLRRYVIISGLRLRLTDFWADATISLLLCAVFLMLCVAHGRVSQIGKIYRDAYRRPQPIHWRG
jgi:hypothetical protein